MKLELFIQNDYAQINHNTKYVHISQLNTVENASYVEIEVNDCLDYILERDQVLQTIISKLRYNGILRIDGNDLDAILVSGPSKLSNAEIKQLLYNGRSSIDSLSSLKDKLIQLGLTIHTETLNNYTYFIAAKRELNHAN